MYMYLYLLSALGKYHAIDTLCIERIHALATTLPTSRKVGVTSIIKVAAFKWDFANCSSRWRCISTPVGNSLKVCLTASGMSQSASFVMHRLVPDQKRSRLMPTNL